MVLEHSVKPYDLQIGVRNMRWARFACGVP
jgi:hypothetical protein